MAKKGKKKKTTALKVIMLILVGILGVIALVVIAYAGNILKLQKEAKRLTEGITKDTFRQTQTSIVYDINGEEITRLSGIKDVYYLNDEDIPSILKKAFVILEDQDFYNHKGVDFSAILRAALADMKEGAIVQGASTITQQLAKNVFLSADVKWERKITEAFVAMELEKKFSKTQIMEFYINNIYFSHGYYGIEAAAQGYFGKTTRELTLSQLAFLAAIPKNPSKYDPITKFDSVVERRDFILKQLYAAGYIDSHDFYAAMDEQIVLVNKEETFYNYVETYVFHCATRALMEYNGFTIRTEFTSEEDEQKYNELYDELYSTYQATLFTAGYRIYTSIDIEKQELLQNTVDELMKEHDEVSDEGIYLTQAAAVCIDNSTGYVTAIVGGRSQDYDGYTLNRAYQSYRQTGSAIKPLNVYAPYMILGHDPNERIEDVWFEGGPNNSWDTYRGNISLKEALAVSSNVCAWKIMMSMTPEYGNSYLHKLKFRKVAVDDDKIATSIGGFTYGASPVEMASGYAALENDGVYRNPTCVSRITNAEGSILVDYAGNGEQVYSENAARMATKMMEYGVNDGILQHAQLENAIVAAKSGTTNGSKDGWLCGYSRYYTTVVWVGDDIPKANTWLSGGGLPLDIWKTFMEKIHEGRDRLAFPDYTTDIEDDDSEYSTTTPTEGETATHPTGSVPGMDIDDGDTPVDVSGQGDKDAR